MTDIYARALLPEGHPNALGPKMPLADLALLRASSIRSTDSDLFASLLAAMESLIKAGTWQVDRVVVAGRPTGEYRVTETATDPRRWAPGQLGRDITTVVTVSSGKPPKGAVPVLGPETFELWVTRQQAQHLFALDPDDWSDGAKRWAGVTAESPEQTAAQPPPAPPSILPTPAERPIPPRFFPSHYQAHGAKFMRRDGSPLALSTLLQCEGAAGKRLRAMAKSKGGWLLSQFEKWLDEEDITRPGERLPNSVAAALEGWAAQSNAA